MDAVVPAERKSLRSDGFRLDGSPFAKLRGRKNADWEPDVSALEAAAGWASGREDFHLRLRVCTQMFLPSSSEPSHHAVSGSKISPCAVQGHLPVKVP